MIGGTAAAVAPRRRLAAVLDAAVLGASLATVLAFGMGTASYDLPKWAGVHLVAVLALARLAFAGAPAGPAAGDRLDLLILLWLGWLALSLAWTPDPGAGLLALGRAAVLAIVVVTVRRLGAPGAAPWIAAAALVVPVVAALRDWQAPGPEGPFGGFGNPNFETEVLLACVPWIGLGLVRGAGALRLAAAIGLAAVAGWLLLLNSSRIELVAGPGTALVAGLWWLARRRGARASLAAAVLAATGFAAALPALVPRFADSVVPRAELAVNTLAMWLEHPLRGQGLAGFAYTYPRLQEHHLAWLGERAPRWDTLMDTGTRWAGAAHDDPLQLLAETGLVGLGLAAGVLVAGARRFAAAGPPDALRAGGALVVVVVLFESLLEFPFQNPATAFLAATGFALAAPPAVGAAPGGARATRLRGLARAGGLIALAVIAAGAFGLYRNVLAERHFRYGKLHLARDPALAYHHNLAAWELFPLEREYRAQLYFSLAEWAERRRWRGVRPEVLDRAYAISASASPDTPGLLLARSVDLINTGRWRRDPARVEALLARMRAVASRLPETYLAEAQFAVVAGQPERARAAIARARATGRLAPHQSALADRLEARLGATRTLRPRPEPPGPAR